MKRVCSFIEQESALFPVKDLCLVLDVPRATYYRTMRTEPESRQQAELRGTLREAFWKHRRRYGSRRLEMELKAEGVWVGRRRIRSIMREEGLRAIQPRSFVPKTTDSRHKLGYSENLLISRELPPLHPNEVIVGDITYLPLEQGGFAYLATWEDLFSRMIIGWEVDISLEERLIRVAFERGLVRRVSLRGAIVHSDRGGQYASANFRSLLKASGCRQSMSRASESYDNPFAESLFSRYKAELLDGRKFRDLEEARIETFGYIEGYFNRIRRHSGLGYVSPEEYERKYYEERNRQLSEEVDENQKKGVKAKAVSCLKK